MTLSPTIIKSRTSGGEQTDLLGRQDGILLYPVRTRERIGLGNDTSAEV